MKRNWNKEELIEYFTIFPAEKETILSKNIHMRLDFGILLKFFQYEGAFPKDKKEIPKCIINYISKQLEIPVDNYQQQSWDIRSLKYQRTQIRNYLNFRQFTLQDRDNLKQWLCQKIFPYSQREKYIKDAVAERFKSLKIEPPREKHLERIIQSSKNTFEQNICEAIYTSLSKKNIDKMNELLNREVNIDNNSQKTMEFDSNSVYELKKDPGSPGVESVLTEISKLNTLRALSLSDDIFKNKPLKVIYNYKQRILTECPGEIKRHPKVNRYAFIAAFCYLRSQEIIDNITDMLIQIIHRIEIRAEKRAVKELISDLRQVRGKMGMFAQLVEAMADYPKGIIDEVLYPIIGEQTIQDLLREFKATGSAYRLQVQTKIRSSYLHHYRRIVPAILNILTFRSNNKKHQPVIEALNILKKYNDSKIYYYPDDESIPTDDIIPVSWKDIVIKKDKNGKEKIDRVVYEVCVLKVLCERLKCKEIWVLGANRYRNPDEDLPNNFDEKKDEYYQQLQQPTDVNDFILHLKNKMKKALEELNTNIVKNSKVKLEKGKNGKSQIHIDKLKAQAEGENIQKLKAEVFQNWSMVSLLDILKEVDLRVSFTEQFKSIYSSEKISRNTLQKRLLLCLYGLGTNLGLKRVIAGDHGEKYNDLLYVKKRYINKDNLRAAIVCVVNAILRDRLAHIWGEATTSCASDSKQFGAWDQNLMTEWHQRYGGRGIMIYWHVGRRAACVYSQLDRCSSSEVSSMIEGVLRHCTDMAIDKQYVDTHGQSHVAFAFCYLLGFKLLPRLKGIRKKKLYLPEKDQLNAYPNLNIILTRPINWKLISEQYNEMIKYTSALRLGTANAESILRRFTRNNRKHPTYQALSELGKAVLTIFLCDYLKSEKLRYEIQEGLNIIELWNGVNDFIFYGRGREISTNRREDQEIIMLSLHLLQNCLIYINTLMLQRVLTQPHWENKLETNDYRALNPLFYAHVNPYGSFRLNMDERIAI